MQSLAAGAASYGTVETGGVVPEDVRSIHTPLSVEPQYSQGAAGDNYMSLDQLGM